ncbi:MAG: ORF6N domain-containing protein [Arcobacteraceae bacterium]
MNENSLVVDEINIHDKIYTVRGLQVMLDRDLAKLYSVETKNLNKAVSRNRKRFPEKFRFQLIKDEYDNLRFQFGTLGLESKSEWGKHTKYLQSKVSQCLVLFYKVLRRLI